MTKEKITIITRNYLCEEIKEEERLSEARIDLSKIGEDGGGFFEAKVCKKPTIKEDNHRIQQRLDCDAYEEPEEGDHIIIIPRTKQKSIKIQSKEYFFVHNYDIQVLLRK